VRSLLADPVFAWHDAAVDLVEEAQAGWLARYPDQPFSFTDAVTFALMRRERIRDAFAYDHQFVVAGFRLLD
jgi:predicted nucleic acid-binding protein